MVEDFPLRRLQRGPNGYMPTTAEEETRDILEVFRDQEAIDTYNNFLGYVPDRPDSPVETIVLHLACLDACICTVNSLLSPQEPRGCGLQKLHSETIILCWECR